MEQVAAVARASQVGVAHGGAVDRGEGAGADVGEAGDVGALVLRREQPVVLEELAAGAGLSPFYLHRLFKKHVGMTPREYAAARRLQRVGDGLRAGATVTTAIRSASCRACRRRA